MSESHCRVDFYYDNIDHEIASNVWDVLSGTILFDTAPTNGYVVKITVSTDGQGLETAPSDNSDVAANIDEVVIVANNIPAIVTNAENIVVIQNASANAIIATEQATISTAQAVIATGNAVLTAADVVSTNADVVLTNADVVTTGEDVAATGLDVVSTNADVVITGGNVTTTNADVLLTNASVIKANQWAEEVEDVEIEAGKFSAYHWSQKAAEQAGDVAISTIEFTNKTMDSMTNTIGADHIHYKVKATENLVKGDVVTMTGYNSGEDATEVAKCTSSSCVAIGIVEANITNGSFGLAINTGVIEAIDTSGYTFGSVLYSDGIGGLTSTKPIIGNYQALAFVVRASATTGALMFEATEPQRTTNKIDLDLGLEYEDL